MKLTFQRVTIFLVTKLIYILSLSLRNVTPVQLNNSKPYLYLVYLRTVHILVNRLFIMMERKVEYFVPVTSFRNFFRGNLDFGIVSCISLHQWIEESTQSLMLTTPIEYHMSF